MGVGVCGRHTMMKHIPPLLSRRVKYPARRRMTTVTGMAAMVRANSASVRCVTTTTNWTVNPKKKKKSNFKRAT